MKRGKLQRNYNYIPKDIRKSLASEKQKDIIRGKNREQNRVPDNYKLDNRHKKNV